MYRIYLSPSASQQHNVPDRKILLLPLLENMNVDFTLVEAAAALSNGLLSKY